MWIFTALGLGASICATAYLCTLGVRLEHLESAPRVEPREVFTLRTELEKIESSVSSSLEELAKLRNTGERTVALDQRIGEIEGELKHAADQLSEQRAKIADFEGMKDEIGPSALDRRMAAFERTNEDHWKHIDQDAHSAVEIAASTKLELENAKQDLDQLGKHLERDKDRMWRELVGPTVQLMGEDTVGSGVLLESEPIQGSKEYCTYLLTAWHVVRDIQNGLENIHKPVPLTIYGQDHKLWPETAQLLKYDPAIDGALLKLNTTRRIECGAKLAPRSRLAEVKIFEQVYAVGCPLGNDPIPTFGEIADTHHVVDSSHYWMISAPTYIGNSGGGIFDAETHELMGIFSKIYTHGSLRPTVVPHMGLVTSLTTIYDWLDTVGYASLVPAEDSIHAQTASAKR
jgi:hypothetical protein